MAQSVNADDNVGRFPPREWATEDTTFEVLTVEQFIKPVEAIEPLPPPLPTITPPAINSPYNATPVYGWPGADEGLANSPAPFNFRFALARYLLDGYYCLPDAPARHLGIGEPLQGTSWLNRPGYSALLIGSMIADDLRSDVELHNGLFVGLHQGWDFDHYHGIECRLAGGSYDIYDSRLNETADIFFADVNLLYYPWGDALWRPYYSIGLGLAYHHARVDANRVYDETLIGVPLGIGLKYQWKRHCAMRFDIKHNLNYGGGGAFNATDHVSLSYGFEYRYGGRPKSYYPWNPSTYIQ